MRAIRETNAIKSERVRSIVAGWWVIAATGDRAGILNSNGNMAAFIG